MSDKNEEQKRKVERDLLWAWYEYVYNYCKHPSGWKWKVNKDGN